MKHTKTVTQQRPCLAAIPFDQISWGDVLSWMPGYINGLITVIIEIINGISARKGAEA